MKKLLAIIFLIGWINQDVFTQDNGIGFNLKYNDFSDMHAMITCLSSGSSLHLFPWDEKNISFAYNSSAPTIQWSYAPPNTAVLNTPYNISVSTTGNGLVTWTVSPFGGIVMSTGSNSGNLIFWTPGIKTIIANITDSCTGLSASVNKQVTVQ